MGGEILKQCPFCGGGSIAFDVKSTSRDKRFYVQMRCRRCGAAGRKVLIKTKEFYRYDVERNKAYRDIAQSAWNRRAESGKQVL